MSKHSPRLFGFTLLELLVVISIIGILAAIGLPAFSKAQQQGRDARRRGDMKSVQNAMEQFYVIGSTYDSGCSYDSAKITAGLPSVIVSAPISGDYKCAVTAGPPSTYCACAKLDGTSTKGNATDADCGGFGTTTGSHFCVKSLQ